MDFAVALNLFCLRSIIMITLRALLADVIMFCSVVVVIMFSVHAFLLFHSIPHIFIS